MSEEMGNQTQEIVTEVTESTEQTTTEQQTEGMTQEEKQAFLKIKYNKEEIALDEEKAREFAQKGMNYDKAVERAKQEARDAYIAEQGYEWNGKPIKTEAEYKQALKEKELVDKGYDPVVIQKAIEDLPEVKWAKEYMTNQQKEEARRQDQIAFLNWFKEKNGREFDTTKDQIDPDVWQAHLEGNSLKEKYIANQYVKNLEQELADIKKAKEIAQINESNEAASTGSLSGNGTVTPSVLTEEMISKMEPNELMKRWGEVKKVLNMK